MPETHELTYFDDDPKGYGDGLDATYTCTCGVVFDVYGDIEAAFEHGKSVVRREIIGYLRRADSGSTGAGDRGRGPSSGEEPHRMGSDPDLDRASDPDRDLDTDNFKFDPCLADPSHQHHSHDEEDEAAEREFLKRIGPEIIA
jgi:hypothetical protein